MGGDSGSNKRALNLGGGAGGCKRCQAKRLPYLLYIRKAEVSLIK